MGYATLSSISIGNGSEIDRIIIIVIIRSFNLAIERIFVMTINIIMPQAQPDDRGRAGLFGIVVQSFIFEDNLCSK